VLLKNGEVKLASGSEEVEEPNGGDGKKGERGRVVSHDGRFPCIRVAACPARTYGGGAAKRGAEGVAANRRDGAGAVRGCWCAREPMIPLLMIGPSNDEDSSCTKYPVGDYS
jgi:hypothetical protein